MLVCPEGESSMFGMYSDVFAVLRLPLASQCSSFAHLLTIHTEYNFGAKIDRDQPIYGESLYCDETLWSKISSHIVNNARIASAIIVMLSDGAASNKIPQEM